MVEVPKMNGDAARFADELIHWFETAGETKFEDAVTQHEHAVQSAALAADDGAPEAEIIAALLHDVGHLLADEHQGAADYLKTDRRHEAVGANWLERAYPADVVDPIRLHVDAKRYLCGVDPAYRGGLSETSIRSLDLQGGAFGPAEAQAFENLPGALAAARLRRYDDLAKIPGKAAPPMARYRDPLIRLYRDNAGSG